MQKTRKMVELKSLKNSAHNPPNRIVQKNIKILKQSMKDLGLLQPITVSPTNVIIEGHRRVAAAIALGWKEIEANVVKDCDADFVYSSVNATSRKLSGSDSLYVWLKNPKAVVPAKSVAFTKMQEVIGRPLVKQICDKGFSIRVYQTAKTITKYCEVDDDATMKQVVKWLLTFPVIGSVMKAIEAGESPRKILDAVRKNKTVKLSLAIG